VKLVIDVNLSPRWVGSLAALGVDSVHWSTIGQLDAEDTTILAWAKESGSVLLTCDLDFGAILAASGAASPSVIVIRARDVLPEAMASAVASLVADLRDELDRGALVSLDAGQARARVLPLTG
jgi:predicted nuclease of predicted toxin-antitoxin system